MNPSICFDIIIDYEKDRLDIIPKISESFIYNLKKILIEKEKNKENSHFANITLESATIFLSEFKKIIANIDNSEFEEHFLEISS
jgi:hypothetical protein